MHYLGSIMQELWSEEPVRQRHRSRQQQQRSGRWGSVRARASASGEARRADRR